MKDPVTRGAVVLLVLMVLGFLTYVALTMPDQRSTGDKISDAFHALPDGPDKAARALQDRTPGQRLGDAIKNNMPSQTR